MFACLVVSLFASALPASPDTGYLDILRAKAQAQGLAGTRMWHLLLHYERTHTGGVRSQADGMDFFLAPEGRNDPNAELDATLTSFFAPIPGGPGQDHGQCAFPARYAWLDEMLHFDRARLPVQTCTAFSEWREVMDPASVTLVFASAYLNSPGSMYGHTFLRFDRKRYPGMDLLANAVNYAVDATTTNPVVYTALGLTGGFPGHFQALPYYVKVHTYGDIEARDLWEYRLAFTDAQLLRMLQHIWELDRTHFDYFFFDENCSYHILSVLDVANPALHLLERFHFVTIPADTVRAVLDVPGLVMQRHHRPATVRTMQAQLAALTPEEKRAANDLVRNMSSEGLKACAKLPPERQARVYEAAQTYFEYAHGAQSMSLDAPPRPVSKAEKERQDRARELVTRRAALPVVTPDITLEEPPAPEHAHPTARIGWGAGAWTDGTPFAELQARFALHDLLDDQKGYIDDSELVMGAASVRFGAPRSAGERVPLWLESIDVVRITSMSPVSQAIRMPSWRLTARWGRPPDASCTGIGCGVFTLRGGPGYAAATQTLGRQLFYVFADLVLAAGPGYTPNYLVGVQPAVGLLWQQGERLRMQVEGGWMFSAVGDRARRERGVWMAQVGESVTLGDAWSLRVGANLAGDVRQASATAFAYF